MSEEKTTRTVEEITITLLNGYFKSKNNMTESTYESIKHNAEIMHEKQWM